MRLLSLGKIKKKKRTEVRLSIDISFKNEPIESLPSINLKK